MEIIPQDAHFIAGCAGPRQHSTDCTTNELKQAEWIQLHWHTEDNASTQKEYSRFEYSPRWIAGKDMIVRCYFVSGIAMRFSGSSQSREIQSWSEKNLLSELTEKAPGCKAAKESWWVMWLCYVKGKAESNKKWEMVNSHPPHLENEEKELSESYRLSRFPRWSRQSSSGRQT